MPTISRPDGSTIHYEVFGSGYPLLLIAPGGVSSEIALLCATDERVVLGASGCGGSFRRVRRRRRLCLLYIFRSSRAQGN